MGVRCVSADADQNEGEDDEETTMSAGEWAFASFFLIWAGWLVVAVALCRRSGRPPVRYPRPLRAECEPQHANEDGWTDWITPVTSGYLMQCCDCKLIHEVEFRVAHRVNGGADEYTVEDADFRAQFRMRRKATP
jgi:hypothetical protein